MSYIKSAIISALLHSAFVGSYVLFSPHQVLQHKNLEHLSVSIVNPPQKGKILSSNSYLEPNKILQKINILEEPSKQPSKKVKNETFLKSEELKDRRPFSTFICEKPTDSSASHNGQISAELPTKSQTSVQSSPVIIIPHPSNAPLLYPAGECRSQPLSVQVNFTLNPEGIVQKLIFSESNVPLEFQENLEKILSSWRFIIKGPIANSQNLQVSIPIEYVCEENGN